MNQRMKCIKLKLTYLKLIVSNKVAQVNEAGHSFRSTKRLFT